jgi:hypothetical protein
MPVLFQDERDFIPPEFDGDPGSLPNEDLARLAEEWEYILQLEGKKEALKTSPETLEKLKCVTEKLRRRVHKVLKEMPAWTTVNVHESWDYKWPKHIVTLVGPKWGNKWTLRG